MLLVLSALFNLYQAYAQAISQLHDRTNHSSAQFRVSIWAGKVFKNIRTVGYYTDKDLNNPLSYRPV